MEYDNASGLVWKLASLLNTRKNGKYKIEVVKNGVEIEAPCIVLANHGSIMDYRVSAYVLKKHRPCHVAAANQFAGKKTLMKKLGCVPTVQFVPDVKLVSVLKNLLNSGKVIVIFPESAVSFDGTTREIDKNIAKFVKVAKVPVYSLLIKGGYVAKPRYDEVFRKNCLIEAELNLILSKEQAINSDTQKIHEKITSALSFDVWKWMDEKSLTVSGKSLACGVENLLTYCDACGSENVFSCGEKLICPDCGRELVFNPNGKIFDNDGKKTNLHLLFENQRKIVSEKLKDKSFKVECDAEAFMLDGLDGFKKTASGVFRHTYDFAEFLIDGKPKFIFKNGVRRSVPVGNDFIEFGDAEKCVRFYLKQKKAAMRCALAVEESFKLKNRD